MTQTYQEVHLTTPIPPSVNHMYATGRAGQRFKSDAYRAFETVVRLSAQSVVDSLFTKRLVLTLLVYGLRDNADLDNVIKPLQDALQGVVYVNDKQIHELHVFRCKDEGEARIEVEVREV